MLRNFLSLVAIGFAAVVLSGCSSTPPATDANGAPTYVDDATLESFDRSLRQLAIAIEQAEGDAERGARVTLATQARLYQGALLSALHDGDSTPRRRLASVLLGFTGDAAVIPALIAKVWDTSEDEGVRSHALLGLSVLGEQGDKLRDYPEHEQLMLMLTTVMYDPDSSVRMRRAAIQVYARAFDLVRNNSVEPLRRQMLVGSDQRVRIAAINALGDINAMGGGSGGVVNDLVQVGLNDPDPSIRSATAIALGRINDATRVIPPLAAAAQDDDALVRRDALDGISRHYGSDRERVYQVVVGGLSDFDERVREAAALSLRNIGDDRAIEPLLQATGDRTAVVREAAATALGALITSDREKEAYPLIELLADQAAPVKLAARRSLERVTSKVHGEDQSTWRKYFHTKFPELNPANMYLGKPKPRFSSGISNSGNRARTSSARTQPRNNWNQQRRNVPNRNNNTNRRAPNRR